MSAIDTAMLTAMRSAIGELLPDTCNVLSVTNTPDGMGGNTQSWGTAGTAIACRLDMQTGMETDVGGAIQPFTRFILSVPYDTTVANANRIEHNSVTYSVISVNTNQSWIAVKRVELEKL